MTLIGYFLNGFVVSNDSAIKTAQIAMRVVATVLLVISMPWVITFAVNAEASSPTERFFTA